MRFGGCGGGCQRIHSIRQLEWLLHKVAQTFPANRHGFVGREVGEGVQHGHSFVIVVIQGHQVVGVALFWRRSFADVEAVDVLLRGYIAQAQDSTIHNIHQKVFSAQHLIYTHSRHQATIWDSNRLSGDGLGTLHLAYKPSDAHKQVPGFGGGIGGEGLYRRLARIIKLSQGLVGKDC